MRLLLGSGSCDAGSTKRKLLHGEGISSELRRSKRLSKKGQNFAAMFNLMIYCIFTTKTVVRPTKGSLDRSRASCDNLERAETGGVSIIGYRLIIGIPSLSMTALDSRWFTNQASYLVSDTCTIYLTASRNIFVILLSSQPWSNMDGDSSFEISWCR